MAVSFFYFSFTDLLLSFSHDFAKQEYTTYFGSGSKSALTQSILHGLA